MPQLFPCSYRPEITKVCHPIRPLTALLALGAGGGSEKLNKTLETPLQLQERGCGGVLCCQENLLKTLFTDMEVTIASF